MGSTAAFMESTKIRLISAATIRRTPAHPTAKTARAER
jgi:hypothetical protein